MRKLNAAVDRFARSHPNFGIPNLMKYIVFGNALVYLLSTFAGAESVSFLMFDWAAILSGELWRLITFIFLPGYSSRGDILWLALFLYLYYMIGTSLEREWGTAKFNLYYFSGVVLSILVGIITALTSGYNVRISGTEYVNLSMFFAFAVLYSETRFLVFFIIPVKVKWLAWLNAAFFAFTVLLNLFQGQWLHAFLPVVALLNFFVFFWNNISSEIAFRRGRIRHQTAHNTVQFKAAVRQQKKREAERGYRHKCEICGRTDTEHPELEFRYCSRCQGYHCFCEEHIFNHEHFE